MLRVRSRGRRKQDRFSEIDDGNNQIFFRSNETAEEINEKYDSLLTKMNVMKNEYRRE